MKICPFRLVGVDDLPPDATDPVSALPEDISKAFSCIGPKCMLFRIAPDALRERKFEEGFCSLGRPDR
jgi:hypothetical protein